MLSKNVLKAVLGCAAIAMFQSASASTVSCSGNGYNISGKVSTAGDCAILLPLDGAVNDNETAVNAEKFFGIDKWKLDGKYDNVGTSGGLDGSSLFNFTGNNQSGNYAYVGSGSAPSSIMFVFKDGGETNLVAYLLKTPFADGAYATPFTEPPFDFSGNEARSISHISVYYQTGSTGEVPEPATLAMIGLGLLGMGRLRRKA